MNTKQVTTENRAALRMTHTAPGNAGQRGWRRAGIAMLLLAASTVRAQVLINGAPNPNYGGMQLWLKADAGVTADAQGKVTSWADQSGQNRHATVPDCSASPTLGTTPGLGTKAVPAILFRYANKEGLGGAFNFAGTTIRNTTIFTVVKSDWTTQTGWTELGQQAYAFYTGIGTYDNDKISASVRGFVGGGKVRAFSKTGNIGAELAIDQKFHVLEYNVSGGSGSGTQKFSIDHGAGGETSSSVSWPNLYYYSYVYRVGRGGWSSWHSGLSTALNCAISEVIVYHSSLSQADATAVYNYLKAKYDPPPQGTAIMIK